MEVQFLQCSMLCAENKGPGPSPMVFDKDQHRNLTGLRVLLNEEPSRYSKEAAVHAMYKALYSLYFPLDCTPIADGVFNSPFSVFLALMCLHPDDGYLSIWQIPPLMSKAQFLIRLRGSRNLRDSLTNYLKDCSRHKKPWFE